MNGPLVQHDVGPHLTSDADGLLSGGRGVLTITRPDMPFILERGGALENVRMNLETFGRLNADRSNIVVACPCLTADAHVTRHGPRDRPGWWESLIGPGRAIDPARHFIVCAAMLGGCAGSTGPLSINPHTGRPYGPDFPAITIGDIVTAQRRALDGLGLEGPVTVIGGSIGGFQALEWARRWPERVRSAIVFAAGVRLSTFGLAFNAVARRAITTDPAFAGGRYEPGAGPRQGLTLARQIAHLTYRATPAFERRFARPAGNPAAEVDDYLRRKGDQFVARFDANAYLRLIDAMDRYNLGGDQTALERSLRTIRARLHFVGFSTDWLFPPEQSLELARAARAAGLDAHADVVDTPDGHDGFLLPSPQLDEIVRRAIDLR